MFQYQPNFNTFWDSSIFPSFNSFNIDSFTRTNFTQSPLNNYNSVKGNLLANIALNRAVGEVGYCAKFVQEAIAIAGLGNCTGAHAYQMANTLRYNPNFKEISSENIDINSLPKGCIVIYGQNVRDDEEKFGHIEFALGDGRGVSDGIDKLHPNPSAIFIPV